MKYSFILISTVLFSFFSFGQKKELTNEQYFKNNFKGIINAMPGGVKWLDNNRFILMKEGKKWVVSTKDGSEKMAGDADTVNAAVIPPATPTPYIKDNDVFIKINNKEIRLTQDEAKEINPTLSPDGQWVAYTKNNDLYAVSVNEPKENRLTFDGSELILNGYASWVYMEEILGRASQYRAFWWSPDSKRIAFFRSDDTNVPEYTMTDAPGQHGVVDKIRYPKAGDPNPQIRVGMVLPAGGDVVWASFNASDDQYFGLPYWMPDGESVLVQWMNRDQNELRIYKVNPETGTKSNFMTEAQKTFINLDDEGRRIRFLNEEQFIYQSDKSGNEQLYLHDIKGNLINEITPTNANVTEVNFIDRKNKIIYFTARKENTAHKDFYRVNFNGKNLKRLSFGDFHHYAIDMAPDGSSFITTYSNAKTPPCMALLSNQGKIIKTLMEGKATDFDNTELARAELIRVMSDDSLFSLPMKITWPLRMEKDKKYPVLISIYGGPNAGRVWDNWTLSGTQQWYAKEGLIQVEFDHRASGHFGKKGVDYMYRNLGYWEMKDYSTMVRWLINNAQADPTKISITGFSYGGYMSCYALTYGSDVFTHGMAGGSVTDWSLYDSHYTERYMGTPQNNPDGYKSSSVLTHVSKYKGTLQLVHGIIDENVHLQNSIQLASKLQDLKKDFEFMTYSGGRHGWPGNKWLHYQNMKTRFIYKHLLEKKIPADVLK
jgi:dipeptidyl-peptidase-4